MSNDGGQYEVLEKLGRAGVFLKIEPGGDYYERIQRRHHYDALASQTVGFKPVKLPLEGISITSFSDAVKSDEPSEYCRPLSIITLAVIGGCLTRECPWFRVAPPPPAAPT
jgi:hypothetical protein